MLIIITGATANGKSDISFSLANQLDTEIISADSMQVYRHFDIGTAKPSLEIRKIVKHHFIDIVNPDEEFNAGNFCALGADLLNDLLAKGKIPVIAGGTVLYIKALIEGYSCGVRPDKFVRAGIAEDFHLKGNKFMYERLKDVDPEYAERIHPNDKLRIGRALEVFYISGRPFSSYLLKQGRDLRQDVRYFVIERDRMEVYKRIEDRVDEMFKAGLVDETENILTMGYGSDLKPFQSIGYRQAVKYLNGEIDYSRCVEDTKKETKHYAKRQLTWFNGITYAQKIKVAMEDMAEDIVKMISASCFL